MGSRRERFLTALSKGQPDKVPIFEYWIDKPILQALSSKHMVKSVGDEDEERATILYQNNSVDTVKLYCDVVRRLDLDATCYPCSVGLTRLSNTKAQDKYGRLYNLSVHGEPPPAEPRIQTLSDAEDFNMVSKLELEDFFAQQLIVKEFGRDRAHCMDLNDPFKISWRSRGGMQNFLMDFVQNPKLVHRMNRIATDYLIGAINIACEIGIDAFIMGGDLADERNLLFSKKHYREYFKPYHEEIVKHVHKKGAMIIKHSDGNIWNLLDEFTEVGFDGIHPIQPQCMDIKEVKDYVGGGMAIIGNIDCRNLLVFGNKEEVKKTVKETIKKVAPGGSYVISSSNSIHPDCKPENYVAMIKAAHEYGIYPIS